MPAALNGCAPLGPGWRVPTPFDSALKDTREHCEGFAAGGWTDASLLEVRGQATDDERVDLPQREGAEPRQDVAVPYVRVARAGAGGKVRQRVELPPGLGELREGLASGIKCGELTCAAAPTNLGVEGLGIALPT